MIRRVIQIDEEKCNGCGACAKACHEGAIGMVNGKAKLMRDDYCDGLGDCLPACPTNAISFVEREAAAYDEKAVEENKKRLGKPVFHGCPKLDSTDYSEKLGEIVKRNNIRSITVARMEVPCCGGIEHAVRKAVTDSGKNIPVAVRIITTDGNVI